MKQLWKSAILCSLLYALGFTPLCWGATYYVDATNGNDSNPGISEAMPWKTIAKVNSSQFQPGDFILFKRGETWREHLSIHSSGTSGSPITFDAYGNGGNPIIKGSDVLIGWTHVQGDVYSVVLEREPELVFYNGNQLNENDGKKFSIGFNEWDWDLNGAKGTLWVDVREEPNNGVLEATQRPYAVVFGNDDSYITLRNIIFEHGNHPYLGVICLDGKASHITLINCTGRYSAGSGLFISGTGKSHLIDGCSMHNNDANGAYGFQHDSGSGTETIITNCEIYNNLDYGIRAYASYWIIEENYLHDNGDVSKPGNAGIVSGPFTLPPYDRNDPYGENNIIRRNFVSGQRGQLPDASGILSDEGSGKNQIYYNIVTGCDGPGIDIFDCADCKVYNNIAYGNNKATGGGVGGMGEIRLIAHGSFCELSGVIQNNIGFAMESEVYAINVNFYGCDNSLIITSNNWYKFTGDWYYWDNNRGSDLATWNSQKNVGDDLNLDPHFFELSNNKVILKPDSPCIDAGTFVGLTKDYRKIPVPQGDAVDIGAFEYKKISSPQNLEIHKK